MEHVAAPAMYGEACHVLRATRTTTRSEHGYGGQLVVGYATVASMSCVPHNVSVPLQVCVRTTGERGEGAG